MVDPRTQPVSRTGVAGPKISDEDLYSLAERYGTPYFLIDETTLRKKVSDVESRQRALVREREIKSLARASKQGLVRKSAMHSQR